MASSPTPSTSKTPFEALSPDADVLRLPPTHATAQRGRRRPPMSPDQTCTFSCRQTPFRRHVEAPGVCQLDCSFNFRHDMADILKVPGVRPDTQRYRLPWLEGKFRLTAKFPAPEAPKHFEMLQNTPAEIIGYYQHASDAYWESRPTLGQKLTTPIAQWPASWTHPPREIVRLSHRADVYQRPFLRFESHLKKLYSPVYDRLSKIAAEGTFHTVWLRTVHDVYDRFTNGDMLTLANKLLDHGAGIMTQAARHVKSKSSGNRDDEA